MIFSREEEIMQISKFWLAVAVVAASVVGASVATAHHVFGDVEDTRFYADPSEWASRNGITNGCGNGNFCPNDPVTRGENITFAYRYDQNVVQPSLPTLAWESYGPTDDWDGSLLVAAESLEAPSDASDNSMVLEKETLRDASADELPLIQRLNWGLILGSLLILGVIAFLASRRKHAAHVDAAEL